MNRAKLSWKSAALADFPQKLHGEYYYSPSRTVATTVRVEATNRRGGGEQIVLFLGEKDKREFSLSLIPFIPERVMVVTTTITTLATARGRQITTTKTATIYK